MQLKVMKPGPKNSSLSPITMGLEIQIVVLNMKIDDVRTDGYFSYQIMKSSCEKNTIIKVY